MKKAITMMAVALSLLMLVACTSTPPTASVAPSGASSEATTGDKKIQGDLTELLPTLYEGVPEDTMIGTAETPVTQDMSVNFTGVTADKYKEAVASEALISAQAHSVVLMRANSAEEAEALAKEVEANADPRKWICVEAEKKIVDRVGDTVILIMSFSEIADTVHENFLKLAQ